MRTIYSITPMLLILLVFGCAGENTEDDERPAVDTPSAEVPVSQERVTDPGEDTSWDFEDGAIGSVPVGWKTEQTNPRGEGAQWSIQEDPMAPSGIRVLALTDTRGARGSTFNIAWTDLVQSRDGGISVAVKAVTGREDQGGGPIWRVQDKDNYYIARWNPLENNFRLYYVRSGNRTQLQSANADLPADQWHTIRIEHQGDVISAYLNGDKIFETTDDTFAEPGGVGVWTKADAATAFDDLTVTPVPANPE